MEDGMTLLGLVRSRYRSIGDLARNVGWSYSKTRRIVVGERSPDLNEVRILAAELGLQTAEKVAQVFSILPRPQNRTVV